MAWTGVITNAGANLLDQWALGGTLTITSAATGTGTVDTAALVNQTNLKSRKQTASIISTVRKSSGVKVKLQITAPSTGYTLNQYGVWAKLGSGAAVLLALFQREDGVPIPSSAETPEFVYTLYALLTISNTGTLEVTVDTSALVSQSTLEEAMDTKVDKVSGKGLSTNDYTTAEKNKLAGIEAQANKYIHPSYTARTGKPTANLTPGFGDTVTVSQITSDASGHVTGATDRTVKIPATAASTSAAGLMSAADKTKLNGVATGAEVNQNAFSNVKIGSTTIAADAKTDTLEIVAGDNITLTPDATNDKVTIAATDTTYSSKAAASGGTAVSLVTTGEKYTWNSKANGSHTHSADDIASGTLPVAKGGTGATSASAAITALGGPDITGQGTHIPDNTDLNTIVTPGTYKSQSAADSATMPNAPWTSAGFKLFVVQGHWVDAVKQIVLGDQTLYIRSTTTATHANPTWTAWAPGATKVHTHAASDISSGTLPVARGGTGNSTGYVTAGLKSGTTLGSNATAEGSSTTASGDSSHAEGWKTTASELASHAEGSETVASGEYSHAEGWGTKTTTPYAHAEGCSTEASGTAAHAEGFHTIASRDYQHVFGQYNATSVNSVEIVGWGTSSTRKNIRTLDQSGNMTIAGTLTQSSDARLKDVQGEVPDLSGIRAVRFKWNDTNGEHDEKDHIGYIAQEVEAVAPYLVGDDSNGYKSLDYIALLVAKVEYLERRVAELERKEAGA